MEICLKLFQIADTGRRVIVKAFSRWRLVGLSSTIRGRLSTLRASLPLGCAPPIKWLGYIRAFHDIEHSILVNVEQTSDLAVRVPGS